MSPPPIQPISGVFSLFFQFPPEIQLEILNHCSRIDLICLSLTGHDLRSLTLPLIPSKPSLILVDQLESNVQHLSNPLGLAVTQSQICNQDCTKGKDVVYEPQSHRHNRHYFNDHRICWPCRNYPSEHPTCQVPRCKRHCACISCPLYMRLRGWMGKRRYCSQCRKFTTRTKKQNGRCMFTSLRINAKTDSLKGTHGRVKVRKAPDNYWSRKKGLSYGYRWWRKWGTHGIDNEAYQPDATRRINARVV